MKQGLLGKAYRPTFIVIFVIGSVVCGLIIWRIW